MKSWLIRSLAGLAALAAAVPSQAAPVGPVVNGEFEVAASQLKDPACALFGDAALNLLPPDYDPHVPDPLAPGDFVEWPWLVSLAPCEAGIAKAAQWSTSRVTQFADDDGDGDREAIIDGRIEPDPFVGADHNFWQSWASPHQAYWGDFDALRFRVEAGTIPAGASVQISYSATPFQAASPWAGVFIDCSLTFRTLTPVGGLVSVDPTTADFRSEYADCNAAKSAWDAAGPGVARHSILRRLRIVQLSFWRFQTGDPIRIDGVELFNGKTVAGV